MKKMICLLLAALLPLAACGCVEDAAGSGAVPSQDRAQPGPGGSAGTASAYALAAPQIPVLSLAVVSPKWVRCYLSETELTRVKMGDQAKIHFDGADAPFDGWVGFISPNAEFTPKNIETAELRTNLVYEMRVYVNDPENRLKLGAPATVSF